MATLRVTVKLISIISRQGAFLNVSFPFDGIGKKPSCTACEKGQVMPELPEVQTIVDDLIGAGIAGRDIVRAEVFWPATVAMPSAPDFLSQLEGQTIHSIQRRGKFIVFQLAGSWILAVHLRMTGRFFIADGAVSPLRHVHVVMAMNDGRVLCFHDTRKFGRFYLTEHTEHLLGALGPEPLSSGFTAQKLRVALGKRKRQIKPLLLDQAFIAGLGNIYVDEALWTARIHPLRQADSLSMVEAKALHAAIRKVLRQGLRNRGTTLGNGQGNFFSLGTARGANEKQLRVFRRTGQPCYRCGRTVQRMIVGQRSTHLCSGCQSDHSAGRV